MPVGAYSKDAIREMALDAGFPNADKPDSQGHLLHPVGRLPGVSFTTHNAHARRDSRTWMETFWADTGVSSSSPWASGGGLGINAGEPQYVISIDAEGHRIVVGPRVRPEPGEFPGLQGQLYIRDASQWAGGRYRQGALQVQGSARSPL